MSLSRVTCFCWVDEEGGEEIKAEDKIESEEIVFFLQCCDIFLE